MSNTREKSDTIGSLSTQNRRSGFHLLREQIVESTRAVDALSLIDHATERDYDICSAYLSVALSELSIASDRIKALAGEKRTEFVRGVT